MKTIRIGKNDGNDYRVNDDTVSRYHAQMTVTDSGEVFIKDLGSTNGTFVDGKKIQAETKLMAGNVVRLGNKVINWMDIVQKGSNETKVQNGGAVVGSISGKYLVGRDEKCQVRFSQSEVSGRHAMLEKNAKGEPQITDMGSTNGTFVNGQRIFSATELHKGDVVLLANKFPLNWEQYIPASKSNKKAVSHSSLWITIAACATFILLVAAGAFYYQKNREWAPEKVYGQYKNSVVLILVKAHYAPYYKGQPIYSMTLNESFEAYSVDEDGDVIKSPIVWCGSGSFVSEDGLIVTNRHVANMPADEDRKNKEKIKKQIKTDLVNWFGQVYDAYSKTRDRQQRSVLSSILDNTKEIFNNEEDIEIVLEYDFMGVALNDTHVNPGNENDFLPCSFIKNHPDEKVDAALMQLNNKQTPGNVKIVDIVNFSRIKHRELGCKVYTIGFPNHFIYGTTAVGLEANNQSGEITQDKGDIVYGHNMQIKGGASGSPVFDSHGRFAGLIVSGWTYNGVQTGYNSAVRPEKVAELMNK